MELPDKFFITGLIMAAIGLILMVASGIAAILHK